MSAHDSRAVLIRARKLVDTRCAVLTKPIDLRSARTKCPKEPLSPTPRPTSQLPSLRQLPPCQMLPPVCQRAVNGTSSVDSCVSHQWLYDQYLTRTLLNRGRNNYIGEATGAAALVGCLCFCLPGLLILLCPFDERDAYMYEGRVYDAAGRYLGTAGQTSFVPTRR